MAILGLAVPFSTALALPPDTPQNARAEQSTISARLEWDWVSEATQYQLEYKESPAAWDDAWSDTTIRTYIDLMGLRPDVSYDFRVRAVNADSESSAWSDTVTFQTNVQYTYNITTCRELQAIVIDPVTFEFGADLEGRYVLQNDIDCAESETWDWSALSNDGSEVKGFLPIFNIAESDSFTGELDGQGYTIRNITQRDLPFAGLFYYLEGYAHDFTIEDSILAVGQGGEQCMGTLAASALNATIHSVHVTNVSVSRSTLIDSVVGGLVGCGYNVTVDETSVSGLVEVAMPDTGGYFNEPTSVALNASGQVAVADTYNDRIQLFSADGTFIQAFGERGCDYDGNMRDGSFCNPNAVIFDSVGNIYVADTGNHRIQKFDSNGDYLAQWGTHGSAAGEFDSPRSVAFDSVGNIYVVDMGNHRIQKFGSNGDYLAQWGGMGNDPGQLYYPYSVTISGGDRIFVVDSSNDRIQEYQTDGSFVGEIGLGRGCNFEDQMQDGSFCRPSAVTVDSADNIYVVDTDNFRVQKFNASGTFVASLTSQGCYSTAADFCYAQGVSVASNGDIYIADTGNDRISVFNDQFELIRSWGQEGNLAPDTTSVVGGLIGAAEENTVVSRSSADATMTNLGYPNMNTGGLVGAGAVRIDNSFAVADITTQNQETSRILGVGGLVGSGSGTITKSYATGLITTTGSPDGASFAGGIVGVSGIAPEATTINDVMSTMSLNVENASTGALVGAAVVDNGAGLVLGNNYYDASRAGVADCVAVTVDGSMNPVEGVYSCFAVNADGDDGDYFYNTTQNPPLDTWDFNTIWRTKPTELPTLISLEPAEPTLPSVPRSLSYTATTENIKLTWLPPSFTGYASIAEYVVQYRLAGDVVAPWQTHSAVTQELTINDVAPGQYYEFRVAATNSVGTGPYSSSITAKTLTTSDAVQNLTATMSTNDNVVISWQPPADTGGSEIIHYAVDYRVSNQSSWTRHEPSSTDAQVVIAGLVPGQAYDFRVVAVNQQGQSEAREINGFTISQVTPATPVNNPISYYQEPVLNEIGAVIAEGAPLLPALPQLTWQPSQRATSYVVEHKNPETGNWETYTTTGNTSLNVDFNVTDLVSEFSELLMLYQDEDYFNGLTPGEQAALTDQIAELQQQVASYFENIIFGIKSEFRIAAINDYGQSSFTEPIEYQWSTGMSTCAELQNAALQLSWLNDPALYSGDPDDINRLQVILMNDIDCSETTGWNGGMGWSPGDIEHMVIDGQGYTISNVYSNDQDASLFNTAVGSDIKNFTILNPMVMVPGNNGGGAIIAKTLTRSRVDNVRVLNGQITASGVNNIIGGVAARAYYSEITNTDVSLNISGSGAVAGLVGQTLFYESALPVQYVHDSEDYPTDLRIDNSTVSGSIEGSGVFVAGLVGQLGVYDVGDEDLQRTATVISDSAVSADITAECAMIVGGAVAVGHSPIQMNSFSGSSDITASCDVEDRDEVTIGGFVGGLEKMAYSEEAAVKLTVDSSSRTGDIHAQLDNNTRTGYGSAGFTVGGILGLNTSDDIDATVDDVPEMVDSAIVIISTDVASNITTEYNNAPSADRGVTHIVAGLIGGTRGAVHVQDSSSSGLIQTLNAAPVFGLSHYVSGMVGQSRVLAVEGSTSGVEIDTSGTWKEGREHSEYLGGIGAFVYGNLTISHSLATGSIADATEGVQHASTGGIGGLVGAVVAPSMSMQNPPDSQGWRAEVIDSHSTGDIFGGSSVLSIGEGGGSGSLGGLIGGAVHDLTIKGSYATGDVINTDSYLYSSSGGLIGGVGGRISIEDSYATGDVLPIDVNVEAPSSAGGLIGAAFFAQSFIERSFATGDVYGHAAGGILGSGNAVIRNVFARGDVKAMPNSSLAKALLLRSEEFADTELVTSGSAGGVIGQALFVDIQDSYASGQVSGHSKIPVPHLLKTILEESLDQEGTELVATLDSYIRILEEVKVGGLVGSAHYIDAEEGEIPYPWIKHFTIKNSFSASPLRNSEPDTGAAIVGVTAPGLGMFGLYWPASISDTVPSPEYQRQANDSLFDGVYSDTSILGLTKCGNALRSSQYGGGNSVANEFSVLTGCHGVNIDNTPGYFMNNTLQSPLNEWDFTTVWRTNAADYPDFIGSSVILPPPYPGSGDNTPPIDPTNPGNPNQPPAPQPPTQPGAQTQTPSQPQVNSSQVGSEDLRAPDGADSSNSEQSGGSVALEGALSPESNVDGTLKTVDGRVLSAWTSAAELVPFSIVAFIIALAVFYTYVGIQEHRQRKVLTALLKKIKRRKGLQRQFIEIISHYLHTPLTKLSGTMELLSSTNTLSSALREQGARLVSELKSQLDALLAKAEVVTTAQQRVNTVLERVSLPFILRQPVFWLPTVLFVLVTAMIHYAYIYISKSDVLTATILLQLSIGAVALTALVISLYYYNKARFAYNLASAEYAAEDDLYKQQNTFMQSALQQLSERISELKLFESTHAISRLPHAAGFGAGLGEFEVILGKIDRAVGATTKSLHVTDAVSDISQSLDRAVSVISEEVSQKDIQLKLDIPQKMTAHIDTDDLVYALSAILQNAIRFSPNHSEISVKIKRNQSGVEIAVTDSGPGVPESELAGIFKPFHRVEDVHTFNYEGVGLSLFTVKKLVESYSGTVRAERSIASGLRVVVWLPT